MGKTAPKGLLVIAESGGYASGNWFVKEGDESRLVSRWTEFLEWTRSLDDGFGQAVLIQDAADPRHFVSIAQWHSHASQEAWRAHPEWPDKFNPCRELCDRFEGAGAFLLAATVGN